jgi:hypothetical protein
MISWFRKKSNTEILLKRVLENQHRMEHRIMGALEDALAAEDAVLQQVVDLINNLPDVTGLQQQVALAQEQLAALQADHDMDTTQLESALAEIASATETVGVHTQMLKDLVPPPQDTPVDGGEVTPA